MTKRWLRLMLLVAMGQIVAWGAEDPKQQSYRSIWVRNAFGLRDLPPAPPPPTNPPPQVNITFTGVTRSGSMKKAFFQIPKEGKPNEFEYPMLGEGEPFGNMKVLAINLDEHEPSVKVENSGQVMTLNFKTHGLKKAAAPPMMAPPGGVPPGGMRPPAIMAPGAVPAPNQRIITPGAAQPGIPAPGRVVTAGGQASTLTPGNYTAANLQPMPSRTVRTLPPAQIQQTYEESHINMEIQRTLNAEKIAAGQLPPLPPTALSEGAP